MHKLLLADDSVTIQRVIELTFSGEDVQVVAVNDGEQAIARIPIERPDVVLADIGMPRKGGYDVAAFVKGRPDLAHIPVLLLAGAFEPVDQARAEQVHADGVLIKPFEPRQVIERVKELLSVVPQAVEYHPPAPAPQPDTSPAPVTTAAPHPAPDVVAEAAPELAEEPKGAGDAGQSLDELFESLNQALSATAKPAWGPTVPAVSEQEAASMALPAEAAPEPTDAAAVVNPEPEFSFEPLVVSPGPGGSLDDYFDRLSVAFAQTRVSAVPLPDRLDVPSHRSNGLNLPDVSTAGAPAAPPVADLAPQEWLAVPGASDARFSADTSGEVNPILEAVTTLLAQPGWRADVPAGQVNGAAEALQAPQAAEPGETAASSESEDIVEAVAERVLAKLAPAVAETLRRLAQQEVERTRQNDR